MQRRMHNFHAGKSKVSQTLVPSFQIITGGRSHEAKNINNVMKGLCVSKLWKVRIMIFRRSFGATKPKTKPELLYLIASEFDKHTFDSCISFVAYDDFSVGKY